MVNKHKKDRFAV